MNLLVIGYLWQNIEVMRLKMSFRETVREMRGYMHEHDRLAYDIEKHRTMKAVTEYALQHGLVRWAPKDIEAITVAENKNKKK